MKYADLFISVSGDCLSEVNGRMNIIEQVLLFDYAHKHNVKTYICAQTMGRFGSDIRWLVKRILKSLDLITIREDITYEYFKEIGVVNNVVRTEDLAFLLNPANEERFKEILDIEKIEEDFLNNKTVVHFTNSWHYNHSFV
ncbi:polysaccharide pyruvyl transferase family protein, partial [Stenotrophomonas maltophilia group sp. RNC7]|uniref:polysaccharide pyruvyl transferase family protein n=1 Tax=Stenotrophomonas maltophilia group sp. RNC7 TaxID=3071467 RepID=UPI0027E0AC1D